MAYPYGYNPYQYYPMYQQQQAQPPAQQPVQQTYSPVINQSGIIWVSGESEASLFPIAPNNAVALWSKDGKAIFLKSADATGKPSMKVYDLVERAESVSDGTSPSDVKLPSYATKDDLSAVVGVVEGFNNLIGSLKSDVDALKGDMYGIAGKKKSKKVVEVADDADE